MRKIFGILTALCILAVFVSSASATIIPPPPCYNCQPTYIPKPYVSIPTGTPSAQNIDFSGSTTGHAIATGGCTDDSQVGTTAGLNSPYSGFSVTDSYASAGPGGYTYTDASGGSQFNRLP